MSGAPRCPAGRAAESRADRPGPGQLDPAQLARVVGFAALLAPSSVAGGLLLIAQWLRQSTNYLNPKHEERVKEMVEEIYPEAFVTTSASIFPQFREFERFTTAAINAFVKDCRSTWSNPSVSRAHSDGFDMSDLPQHFVVNDIRQVRSH